MNQPTCEEIKSKINIAIDILFENDIFLLTNNVHERSISHKFAEYLQILFPDWNVDCEYNRKGDAIKKLKNIPECDRSQVNDFDDLHSVYPDIIIHHRNTRENLLVIEIKTKSRGIACDIEKLKLFTSDPEFRYLYGVFIQFKRTENPDQQWYENGEIMIPVTI
jgi:hypothetical protein